MRQLIGIVLAISVILAAPGVAQEKNPDVAEWEFIGERLPTYDNLNTAGPKFSDVGCEKWPGTLYANYLKLNPEFQPFLSKAKWREKWRRSLVLNSDKNWDTFNHCFYGKLYRQILELPHEWVPRILFCGAIASNINDEEQKSASAAQELTLYAMHGRFSALSSILIRDSRQVPVKYNNDVKYYLQLMIGKYWPPENELHNIVARYLDPDASQVLSSARKEFVMQAFGRGDYQAVLATTKPCE